jgi:hypothetical protein
VGPAAFGVALAGPDIGAEAVKVSVAGTPQYPPPIGPLLGASIHVVAFGPDQLHVFVADLPHLPQEIGLLAKRKSFNFF